MNPIVAACLLLGLASGCAFAVTMELVDIVRQTGTASALVLGVLATSVPVAAFGGALLGAPLTEIFGRRWALLACSLLLILGGVLSALAGNVSDLAFGRIVTGAGIGLSWVAAPLYLSETAEGDLRGRRITLFFCGWSAGILALPLAQLFLSYAEVWREAFWATAILAALALLPAWRCPPSPYWLFVRGDHDEARQALVRLGWPPQEAEAKAAKIGAALRAGVRLGLFSTAVRPVLLLGAALMLMEQLSGSSNILFNQSLVAGLSENGYQLLVAAANLATTLLILALIDRLGRRFLLFLGLIVSAVSMAVMAAALAFAEPPWLEGLIVAIAAAAATLSLGPISVTIICELMPLHARTMGIPLVLSLNFLFDAPVIFSYQAGADSLGQPALFLFYCLATLAGVALLWRAVPETRAMSLERIERHIRSGRPLRSLRPPAAGHEAAHPAPAAEGSP